MSTDGGQQNFSVSLTTEQLRRDAQQAMNQFTRIGNHAMQQGQRIDTQFNQVGNNISDVFKKGSEDAKKAIADLAKNIVGISALMASGSFIKDIYGSVGEFNKQMKIVSTISEDVTENMDKYKRQVLEMCAQLSIAPETAAAALYQINSAGHLGADGMKVLESSARAAIGGVTETATAADAITTILNAYHKSADEAESISDKLFTTVRLGKTTMGELGQHISTVAPLAARYKISIDEVLAAVAQLTKQGNNTASAMTQISASIIAVGNELGDDAFKNGLMAGLDEIEKRANGSNMALKAQLSNIRAVRGAMGLTGESAKETAEMIEQIGSSAGAADVACKKMNTTAGAELTKLRNNFIKEFSDMATEGKGVMGELAKALNSAFDTGRMQDFLHILGLIIAAYGTNRAIVASMAAIERAGQASMLQAEYAAYMQLLPAKEADINADIRAAVASGALTEAKGAELIALRTELSAKIDSAKASLVALKAEEAEAAIAVATAQAKRTAAVQGLAAKEAELTASGQICGAYISETAALELDTAATKVNTATTERNAAAKQLTAIQTKINATSTELETLTHQQNTVTQAGETASTGALAVAKKALTSVSAKLNATIAANPYTLAAAAVIALGVAIYKLSTYETDAEKAQRKLNEAIGECEAATSAEIMKAEVLFSTLKNATEGTAAYEKAKKAVIDQYGQYMQGLVNEKNEIVDLTLAYEQVTAAIKEAARARAMESVTKAASDTYEEKSTKALTTIATKIRENVTDKELANTLIQLATGDIQDRGSITSSTYDSIHKALGNTRAKNGKWTKNSVIDDIKDEVKNYQEAGKILTQSLDDAKATFGNSVNEFADYTIEQLKDARKNLMDDLFDQSTNDFTILGGGVLMKDVNSREQALLALQNINRAIKSYAPPEKTTTDTPDWKSPDDEKKGKTPEQLRAEAAAAHQAELDLIDSQTRERIRAEEDAEFQVQQARIDAMESGADKILAQRELDYQKQQAELQREMEDAILEEIARQKALFDAQEETADANAKRNGNKNYAKRTFNSGGLLATTTIGENGEATQNYSAGQLIAEGTIGNVDTSVINEILRRYEALFADMQTTHNNAWRRTSTDAMNEYLAQWGQGMEKRNAIKAVYDNKIAAAETEGDRLSLIAQRDKELSDFDIEANKKTSAISTLFDDMTEKTVADMKKIYAQGKETLTFLESGEWNAETGLKLSISEETFKTLSKSPEEIERIRKGVKQLKREIDGTESGFKKLGTGLKEVFKAGNDPKKLENALGKVREGMQDVTQAGGFLKDSLAQLGEAFGSDTMGDIAEGIGIAMDAMDSTMQGAEAGAAFGPWGAAAGAAIGLVSSLGSAIAKIHDAKHEEKIEDLQDQIEVLERNYDELGRSIEKAYSKDAKHLIEQQNALLKQQKILIQQQINEEKAKKSSDEDRIKDWEQQIRDIDNTIADNKEKAIDAIFGEDVQAAIDRFSDAYASMFDAGTSRARSSKDLVKDMIKNMIVEAMKSDISKPMEKLREMMNGFWSDGIITGSEQEQLENYVENMFEEQEKKWGWADGYFKDSTSQGSSKGGFTAMSQDSADELNGRFTALQMAGEQIKATTADINEQLKGIAARSIQTASAVDEIRGLQLIAVDHLETIRKHTANLAEMNERLGKIEKYTSRI